MKKGCAKTRSALGLTCGSNCKIDAIRSRHFSLRSCSSCLNTKGIGSLFGLAMLLGQFSIWARKMVFSFFGQSSRIGNLFTTVKSLDTNIKRELIINCFVLLLRSAFSDRQHVVHELLSVFTHQKHATTSDHFSHSYPYVIELERSILAVQDSYVPIDHTSHFFQSIFTAFKSLFNSSEFLRRSSRL